MLVSGLPCTSRFSCLDPDLSHPAMTVKMTLLLALPPLN
jgi:hypothetical protein